MYYKLCGLCAVYPVTPWLPRQPLLLSCVPWEVGYVVKKQFL